MGGVTPLPAHYPPPNVGKSSTMDMRQSFVDYLWNSRAGIPPIAFPYALPWPKRPMPGMGVTSPPFVARDTGDILRPAPASAFTPVAGTGLSPEVIHKTKGTVGDDKDREHEKLQQLGYTNSTLKREHCSSDVGEDTAPEQPKLSDFSIAARLRKDVEENLSQVKDKMNHLESSFSDEGKSPQYDGYEEPKLGSTTLLSENALRDDEDIDVTDEGARNGTPDIDMVRETKRA